MKMLAKSHLSLGLLGGMALKPLFISQNPANSELFYTLILPIILLGAVFPDIDEPKSFIGRKLPLLSRIISLSFSHRGFTHFLAFPLIFFIASFMFSGVLQSSLIAFACGILLHQIGDMLTISGIPHYFFPISKSRAVLLPQYLRFRTGSKVELAILSFVFVPLIALIGMEKFGFDVDSTLKLLGELL